jgi:hypothetical protein
MNTKHNEMAETYKAEFESRNNGQRINNPALEWQTVTSEVASLNNRNAGRGYMVYAQQRIYENATHEQAMAYLVKTVNWQ